MAKSRGARQRRNVVEVHTLRDDAKQASAAVTSAVEGDAIEERARRYVAMWYQGATESGA